MESNNLNLLTLVQEFLDSSSSSDSDIEVLSELLTIQKQKRPKIMNYLTVVSEYSDKQFKESFRITRNTCDILIEGFKNSEFYPGKMEVHCGSKIVSAENHILSFLWFAGNKCCLRDVAERFGIGQTTCFRQIQRVMNYLIDISPRHIQFPRSALEKENMSQEFKKISGFPGIIGCIDGTSITIRTPAHKIKSTYVNRHDIPSITLQGICDFKRRFIDVFTGTPGKIHDSRVYKLSFISKELANICNNEYHIIGDNAYHLREYLLTPYKDYGTLTDMQRNYNYKFSATRLLIENSFGILKNRFRQLTNLDFHKVEKITGLILSCCVLHNLCINADDLIEEENYEQNENDEEEENEREIVLRHLGEIKRDTICARLNNN